MRRALSVFEAVAGNFIRKVSLLVTKSLRKSLSLVISPTCKIFECFVNESIERKMNTNESDEGS